MLAKVVHGENVGVTEGSDGLGFLLETAEALGIAGESGR
jgi:hypothetical protein